MNKMMKLVVILLVATGLIAAGVYFLRDDSATTDESNNQTTIVEGNTITYTNDGFTPMQMRMKAGTLTIKNDSTKKLQVASELHPSHTINPELNATELEPGQTTTLNLTQTGKWNYHNHLDPDKTGTITVE